MQQAPTLTLSHEKAHAFYETLDFARHGYSYRSYVQSDAPDSAKKRGR